jgi:hypothetical protein
MAFGDGRKSCEIISSYVYKISAFHLLIAVQLKVNLESMLAMSQVQVTMTASASRIRDDMLTLRGQNQDIRTGVEKISSGVKALLTDSRSAVHENEVRASLPSSGLTSQ